MTLLTSWPSFNILPSFLPPSPRPPCSLPSPLAPFASLVDGGRRGFGFCGKIACVVVSLCTVGPIVGLMVVDTWWGFFGSYVAMLAFQGCMTPLVVPVMLVMAPQHRFLVQVRAPQPSHGRWCSETLTLALSVDMHTLIVGLVVCPRVLLGCWNAGAW